MQEDRLQAKRQKPNFIFLTQYLEPLQEVGKVLELGEAKYNMTLVQYTQLPEAKQELHKALLRHTLSQLDKPDEDSGCNHLAHIVANALALLLIHYNNKETKYDN